LLFLSACWNSILRYPSHLLLIHPDPKPCPFLAWIFVFVFSDFLPHGFLKNLDLEESLPPSDPFASFASNVPSSAPLRVPLTGLKNYVQKNSSKFARQKALGMC
jgi:hypothetical protein